VFEAAFPHDPQETVDAVRGDEPVRKAGDRGAGNGRGGGQRRERRRRENAEQPLEEPADLEHSAEGEGGRDERRDLGVPPVGVPVGEQHRVGREVGAPPLGQERLQAGGQRGLPQCVISCRYQPRQGPMG